MLEHTHRVHVYVLNRPLQILSGVQPGSLPGPIVRVRVMTWDAHVEMKLNDRIFKGKQRKPDNNPCMHGSFLHKWFFRIIIKFDSVIESRQK